jgi:hypothetical protein
VHSPGNMSLYNCQRQRGKLYPPPAYNVTVRYFIIRFQSIFKVLTQLFERILVARLLFQLRLDRCLDCSIGITPWLWCGCSCRGRWVYTSHSRCCIIILQELDNIVGKRIPNTIKRNLLIFQSHPLPLFDPSLTSVNGYKHPSIWDPELQHSS